MDLDAFTSRRLGLAALDGRSAGARLYGCRSGAVALAIALEASPSRELRVRLSPAFLVHYLISKGAGLVATVLAARESTLASAVFVLPSSRSFRPAGAISFPCATVGATGVNSRRTQGRAYRRARVTPVSRRAARKQVRSSSPRAAFLLPPALACSFPGRLAQRASRLLARLFRRAPAEIDPEDIPPYQRIALQSGGRGRRRFSSLSKPKHLETPRAARA